MNLGETDKNDLETLKRSDVPKTMVSAPISLDILAGEANLSSLKGKNILITGGMFSILSPSDARDIDHD